MTAVLALDQGTTGSTALVLSDAGRVLGRGYREFTQHFPSPGEVEHDAEEILRVTEEVYESQIFILGKRVEEFEKAFAEYEGVRMPKARWVARTAWRLGRAAHFRSRWLQGFRNLVLRLTPNWFSDRQINWLLRLNY